MRAEHTRLEVLGKLFGCSELLAGVSAAIKATTDELAALAAVWQQAAVAQGKLAEWNETVSWGKMEGRKRSMPSLCTCCATWGCGIDREW